MKKLELSILVPVYNEAGTIAKLLHAVLAQKCVKEVVVVDDASTDQTQEVLNTIHSPRVKMIRHAQNQGKGAAIRTALAAATGEYILIQDADMEYDPADIETLLSPVLSGKAEVVFGSRFTGAHNNMFYWHFLGNKFLNFVVNILYNNTLSDMETCYKLIPTSLMRELHLQENDFRIEPEIACKLLRRGIKIFEMPITYVGRSYEEGKKITWIDGVWALKTIFSLRLSTQVK